jgi:hypothetical protein
MYCFTPSCSCLGFSLMFETPPKLHKPDWLRFTFAAAERVLEVMEWGDKQKGRTPGDWKKRDRDYFLRKALRHLVKHIGGEVNDRESGKPHLAHACANLLYALEV